MKALSALLGIFALFALSACESQRPESSRQPHATPATWESGSPMMGGMGTTNG